MYGRIKEGLMKNPLKIIGSTCGFIRDCHNSSMRPVVYIVGAEVCAIIAIPIAIALVL